MDEGDARIAGPIASDVRPEGPGAGTTTDRPAQRLAAGLFSPPVVPAEVLRVVAGVVVVAVVSVWAAVTWAAAVRTVDVDQFRRDLSDGRVVAVEPVRDARSDPGDARSGPWRQVTWTALGDGDPVDGASGETSLVYRTSDAVGPLRLVEQSGPSEGVEELVAEARAASPAVTGDRVGRPPSTGGWPSAVVALAILGLIVFGPAPRWGTRWFWFWALSPGTAIVWGIAYAALELLTRRRVRPRAGGGPPHRRWGGWLGVGVGIVGALGIQLVVLGLQQVLGSATVP